MIHPRRVDGSTLRVTALPDGRVFVDVEPEVITKTQYGPVIAGRGGPEHSRHHHRFEDYGLSDGLLRCRKCGLVKGGG